MKIAGGVLGDVLLEPDGHDPRLGARHDQRLESVFAGGEVRVREQRVAALGAVEQEIGERRVEKTFSNVAVTTEGGDKVQPATTSVTLLGVASFLDSLKPEELKLVLEGNALEPRLDLPDALKGKVVLKSVSPSRFVPIK